MVLAAGKALRLGHADRARMLAALARSLDAGLPAATALAAIDDVTGDRAGAMALTQASAATARGTSLARALAEAGLCLPTDRELLLAAEQAGALPRMLHALADRYEGRSRRGSTLRAQMMLPAAVGLIAIVLLPLPALVAGELSGVRYGLRTGAMLAGIVAVLVLGRTLLHSFAARGQSPWTALPLPFIGKLAERDRRCHALQQLQALLAAGVAPLEAAGVCRRAAADAEQELRFDDLGKRLASGSSLTDALQGARLLHGEQAVGLLSAGEAAGRVPQALADCIHRERNQVESGFALLAEWTPRAIYALIGLAIVYALLAGW